MLSSGAIPHQTARVDTMRGESTCPRRRALAASTAAVLLLCGRQQYAEALTLPKTVGHGAPSVVPAASPRLSMTAATSGGSLSRGASGARFLGDANTAGFHGNNRWKSGAASPLFSSGTSLAHRHATTRLHASRMVRYAMQSAPPLCRM